ncbi:MAG TPA: peptidase M23, partial [Paracoccus sp. (in: a-proteobacteria)]|nr:peptidase M23 [Paracoccus sp. (in: a-proteobacteria)]
FGETGDVLAAGEPVGLMGGEEPPAQEFGAEFVANAATGGGAGQSETLYVELRQDKETLDPAEWFVMNPIIGEVSRDITGQGASGHNPIGQDGTE